MATQAKKNVPKKIEGTDFECEDVSDDEGVHGATMDTMDDENKKLANKRMGKSMDDSDDMDDEGDDDGEEMSKTKKSVLTEANLRKSLRALKGFCEDNDSQTRKSQLLQRALDGHELRKSERSELSALLADREPEATRMGDRITKSMRDNDAINKAIDVSEYLTAQHVEIVKALAQLADGQEALAKSQQEFNLMLAKAHVDTGSVVKSMAERMGEMVEAPSRQPKSAGVTPGIRAVNKSFGAPANNEGELNKSEVISQLTRMNQKSWELGKGGRAACGEDLTKAVARFESSRELSDALRAEVVAAMRG